MEVLAHYEIEGSTFTNVVTVQRTYDEPSFAIEYFTFAEGIGLLYWDNEYEGIKERYKQLQP